MPRKGRGGRREGTPGAAYPNRSDMRTPKPPAYTGQSYGKAKAQADAQAIAPVGPPPTSNIPTPAAAPVPEGPPPGGLGDLFDPTARPNEPLTAGMPFGPGAGPNPFTQESGDPELDILRELYRATGSESLRALIEDLSR